mmetsp:Transcript_5771/g.6272  ORF Transcript_5771/g.6272 Transcript_5771/m.6272 type:complete len:230 (+) Transcript_5771:63-752(+)|eukprot:CAMPEP_0168524362 /NCGR_PEP_ID=MMETSP0405-20121227/10598_1 /TAXON_ID=498012 /ORGANISM="Trichosphaerium sp, Strain Am-I-7 wt" /LENGTH=229 /DNA_ID=CAMNT_0008546541 /DNA_START=27 /DNA_END=716 /DNA_ORIENTATION=-
MEPSNSSSRTSTAPHSEGYLSSNDSFFSPDSEPEQLIDLGGPYIAAWINDQYPAEENKWSTAFLRHISLNLDGASLYNMVTLYYANGRAYPTSLENILGPFKLEGFFAMCKERFDKEALQRQINAKRAEAAINQARDEEEAARRQAEAARRQAEYDREIEEMQKALDAMNDKKNSDMVQKRLSKHTLKHNPRKSRGSLAYNNKLFKIPKPSATGPTVKKRRKKHRRKPS